MDVAGVYIIRVTVLSQNNSGVIICKNKEKNESELFRIRPISDRDEITLSFGSHCKWITNA